MSSQNDFFKDPLLALALLTRVPVKVKPDAFDRSAVAAWAYPLVGCVTGFAAYIAAELALACHLSSLMAACLALACVIFITGAMHEDGLGDCADGFWGGWDPEMRLKIMKDSQIGTYGVLALLITLALRVLALEAVLNSSQPLMLLLSIHMGSRAIMPALMTSLPHARSNGLSARVGRVPVSSALIALCLGAASILIFADGATAARMLLAAGGITVIWRAVALRKIKGQTGDVLGAGQQLAEVALLLCAAAMLPTA